MNVDGRPNVIVANTVKGKGLECAEFNYKWHARGGDIIPVMNDLLGQLAENYGYEAQDVNATALNPDDSIEAAFKEE